MLTAPSSPSTPARRRMRRAGFAPIASAIVAAAAIGATVSAAGQAQAAAGFRDVPGDAYYAAAVQWATDNQVTTGIGGGDRFAPLHRSIRGQAITMLWRTLDRPPGQAPRFDDQEPGSYYDDAVRWARGAGVTDGIGATNRFGPHQPVTRGQTITVIWRSLGRPAGDAPRFEDQEPGSYYDEAVQWAREGGVTTGVGRTDRFEPHRPINRAELVTLLYRGVGSPQVSVDPGPPYDPQATVYLTFDDGPDPQWTPAVLAALRRHGAVASFFALGDHAEEHPDVVRQVVREGHAVENHTMNHRDLTELDPAEVRRTLARTDAAVHDAIGIATSCFRPPGGHTNDQVEVIAADLGLDQVLWTVDPLDYTEPGAEEIADRVLDEVAADSVILLHDGSGDRSQTAAALDVILPELHERGYRTGLVCP